MYLFQLAKYSSGDQNQGMPNYVRLRSGGKLQKWFGSSRKQYHLTFRERDEWCPKLLEALWTRKMPLIRFFDDEETVTIYNNEVKECIKICKFDRVDYDKLARLKKHMAVLKIGMKFN